MDDPVESDAGRAAPGETPTRTGGGTTGPALGRSGATANETSAPGADGVGFRLRIGGTDRPRLGTLGADPARPVTDELPAIVAEAAGARDATVGPDDWEGLPDSVRQDEAREYRTDLDVQRFIADLANQIAASDGSPSPVTEAPVVPIAARAATPAPAAPTGKRSGGRSGKHSAAAATTTTAAAPATTAAEATTAPRAASGSSVAAPAASSVALATAAPAVDDPAPEVGDPTPPSDAALDTDAAPVAEADAAGVETAAAPAASPVAVPSIVEATPAAVVTGQQPVVAAGVPAVVAAPTPAPVALVLPAAQLLPRIEPTPGAPRPTKPVDFRSLLGDAGMPLSVAAKRKQQRHPFRALFKILLVLGLLGGGAYAVKRYYLDSRWAADVEGIAEDVAERRGLEWDDAVPVVVLERNDYALRLASTMLGVDIAQAATLGGEWRAMGLSEGSLDLVAVGSGALADRPAFYDPADGTVYQVAGLSDEVREIALSRALASALLDQQFHWSTALTTASPSVRLGILALFDGDAMAVQASTVAAVLADQALAADATEELSALRLETAPLAEGAPPYAVAITGLAGIVTEPQFAGDLALNPVGRNAVLDLAVTSDAAVIDGARGRSAELDLPAQATTTVAAGAASGGSEAPAATPAAGIIGAASGAAAQTEQAIQETMGAAAEAVATTVAPSTTLVLDDAATVTTVPTAAASATTRGLVYWYYVLAGRIDPGRAWSAALQWQGDLTSVDVSAEGLCVSSIVTTADPAGRDVLLSALQEWAAGAPVDARTSVAAASDTEITVHSCDPGPSADTFTNTEVPLFGSADEEQIAAAGLLAEGLPRSEAARACVFRAVRSIGLPALLESKTLDRSITQRTLDPTAPQVDQLIATCGNE